MYSMKRRIVPGLSRKKRAIGTMSWSFTPRFTTMLILTGARPAASAASMPSSTRSTGNETSLTAWNVSLSSESSETVTRFSPASARLCAFFARSAPFVVSATSLDALDPHQLLDEPLEVAAQQRLAAGQAQLLDALGRERRRDALDLLEREQGGALQELEVLAEHLARHAVDAAEVAAVGDGDAQVAQSASEEVYGLLAHVRMVRARLGDSRHGNRAVTLGYAESRWQSASPSRRGSVAASPASCPRIAPGSRGSRSCWWSRCT